MSTRERAHLSRRGFLKGTAAITAISAAGAAALRAAPAQARGVEDLTARAPDGFVPLHAPGKVVKVSKGGDFTALMQPNQLWPKPEAARQLLTRAMIELTGASNLVEAMKRFVHPKDVVAIKINGIAGQKGATMAVNYEIVQPVVEAVLGVGVPAEKISVFEQYPSYLYGTRVGTKGHELPKGVKVGFHGNRDATMRAVTIYNGIETKYVRYVTEATAVIDLTQIKDHSICGFTGAMKNMTHGQIVNPHEHHSYNCNPQIAMLYNHPVLQSRVRLHIADAFKIIYDGGPLDKYPERRIPHGAVYVSTDAVAFDTVGWRVIEEARKANGLPTLAKAKREPAYIRTAAELGLGVHDDNRITFRQVAI